MITDITYEILIGYNKQVYINISELNKSRAQSYYTDIK